LFVDICVKVTHVPLSPNSIIWYQHHCRERNGSIWECSGLPPI